MAKILYGIQSDGMGLALRSKPVIEHLIKKGHHVKVISSGKPLQFLKKEFKDAENIHCLSFYYVNNKVSYVMTGIMNFARIKDFISKGALKIRKIVQEFKPDIVITDFEAFSSRAANLFHIPLISIDNITVIKLTKVPYNIANYNLYLLTKTTIDAFVSFADHYFVTSFFKLPLKHKRHKGKVSFVPAILRDGIVKAKPKAKNKDHILVYQTTQTNKRLIPSLLACKDEKFIYYGYSEEKKLKNITFRKFSENDFINDLATAKAVITNGGFTFMSEAIYLSKPILSNPIAGQYEQYVNALMIEKKGYGKMVKKMNEKDIKIFIKSLEKYRKNLKKYKQDANKVLFTKLDMKIKKILNKSEQNINKK